MGQGSPTEAAKEPLAEASSKNKKGGIFAAAKRVLDSPAKSIKVCSIANLV